MFRYDVSRLQTLTQDLPGTTHDQSYGYAYNSASQITQRTTSNAAYNAPVPVNGTTNYADNGLNQYTMVVSSTPTYDARGNLTSVAGSSYAYDVFNRLTSATPAGGTAATLAYDAMGRLREVTNTSATTRFLYDGLDAIAEYNASNVLQRRTVHGPGMDEPLVWYEGAGTTDRRYLIADEGGSIVAHVGASTSVYSYDEFGTPGAWSGPGAASRFAFTGQMMLPEAQVYHYRARAYLPALGRFSQTDPIGFSGGMNLYAYVGNDPINFTDPLGLQEEPEPEPPIRVRGFRGWGTVYTAADAAVWLSLISGGSGGDGGFVGDVADAEEIVVTAPLQPGNCGGPWSAAQCAQFARQNRISNRFESQICGFPGCISLILGFAIPGDELALLRRACGCFVEGTQVATPDGLRRIEDIQVGDQVLAWNPETGQTTTQTVTALIRPEPRATYELALLDSSGESEVFITSADHPWFAVGKGWVETVHLAPGDRIVSAQGADLVVQSLTLTGRTEQTYNLEVDGPHTFLVGEDGAVVHNGLCARFADLARHFGDHGAALGVSNKAQYLAQALRNLATGRKFAFRIAGQNRTASITRQGPDSFMRTSANLSGGRIFTHMEVNAQYLRNIGIALPEGF